MATAKGENDARQTAVLDDPEQVSVSSMRVRMDPTERDAAGDVPESEVPIDDLVEAEGGEGR
jgi:hypothetical protein